MGVERETLLHYCGANDDVRIPLEHGDGICSRTGPSDALVTLAGGRPAVKGSAGWLGLRVVEIIHAAYRSVRSARLRTSTQSSYPRS